MNRWEGFIQCSGCSYEIATGDGRRSCSWGECPYLPPELDVFCPNCRFNFFTMEGNSQCGRPGACEHSAEPRSHVANVRTWLAARGD